MHCSPFNSFTPSLSPPFPSLTSSDAVERRHSHNLPLSALSTGVFQLVCFERLGARRPPGELILASSRLIYLPPLLLLFITSHYKLFGNLIGHTDKQIDWERPGIGTGTHCVCVCVCLSFASENICTCNISYINSWIEVVCFV